MEACSAFPLATGGGISWGGGGGAPVSSGCLGGGGRVVVVVEGGTVGRVGGVDEGTEEGGGDLGEEMTVGAMGVVGSSAAGTA